MKRCPETPRLDSTVDLSGHVWVQELPTGGRFRFRVAPSGLVTFGTADRTYDASAAVPVPYRRAAQAISAGLDRDALQDATDDPGAVTFCGVATWNEGVEYPWDSVPAFVGTDVWSGRTDAFLSPDSATGVFERLGLPTLPAIQTERPVSHTDLTRFDDPAEFPKSEWRTGTAVGLLVRDKSGGRAVAWRNARADSKSTPDERSSAELAAVYATAQRIEHTVALLRDSDQPVTIDAVRDRLVADVARESHVELYPDGQFIASVSDFESAVAERVQQHRSDAAW